MVNKGLKCYTKVLGLYPTNDEEKFLSFKQRNKMNSLLFKKGIATLLWRTVTL